MKLLQTTAFLLTFILPSVAQDDPRVVRFSPVYIPDGNHALTDTSTSIVIHGARDDDGLYSVHGVNRRLSLSELEKLLVTFFRDFPTDAKSDAKGFSGLPISKPNLLYKSLSWAETKNIGRDLVTKIAKSENVSLYFFTINPDYSATRKEGLTAQEASTSLIDYYDNRLSSTALTLWPENNNPEQGGGGQPAARPELK